MSSFPCRCIVAAQHKTDAIVTAFLRKTCSERYALMPPLNEFIGQVHESLAPDRARYNGYHATYGSTPVIGTNDKNATTAYHSQNTTKKDPLSEVFFVVFLLLFYSDRKYYRFCNIDINITITLKEKFIYLHIHDYN